MIQREYIRLPKTSFLPDSSKKKRELSDGFWIRLVHSHLLKFYNEFDVTDLLNLIDNENKNSKRRHIEDLIKDYIYDWFVKNDKRIFREGIIVNLESKVKYNQAGFYDMKFQHSDWVDIATNRLKYYSLECKNLNSANPCINEYVFNNSKKDGGVYRHFNGKYAQLNSYGGMLGFVLEGDIKKIKENIIHKLKQPFDISPEGDLLEEGIKIDSIEGNVFTFNSTHKRAAEFFTLHHILFNLQSS